MSPGAPGAIRASAADAGILKAEVVAQVATARLGVPGGTRALPMGAASAGRHPPRPAAPAGTDVAATSQVTFGQVERRGEFSVGEPWH